MFFERSLNIPPSIEQIHIDDDEDIHDETMSVVILSMMTMRLSFKLYLNTTTIGLSVFSTTDIPFQAASADAITIRKFKI